MRAWWLLLPACSYSPGTLAGDANGDGSAVIDGSGDGARVGWSTPVELTVLTENDEDDPSLTNDLTEIYFGSRRGGGAEDIWMSTRDAPGDAWSPPIPASALNSPSSETTAKVTGDGLAIFFASDRGGAGHNIYYSTRKERDEGWSQPMLITQLSTSVGDWAPFAQSNLRRVVLCSGATLPAEALYVSERGSTGAAWPAPVKIAELDEPNVSEGDPSEPHPRALYYASDRLTTPLYNIYRVQRNSAVDPYGSRAPLDEINLAGFNTRDPWVSPDEDTIVFSSDRVGGSFRLYMSTR